MSILEQIHQEDLRRLKSLRYMDDDFMSVCLADNFEGVELILRIILGREDIEIKSVRTQEPMKNLQGRSAVLDVHAIDSLKKEFDVEIQRADKGSGAKRARYFKQDEKGVAVMCKIMEDMINEAAKEAAQKAELKSARETAERLIKKGKMTLEEIAECVPVVSLDELREIETRIMQLA
ncbi:MAG: hypothetical protein NC400_04615 [Clostridium sp.]|nr:hypothetical protein [Clostridium sp.]